VATDRFRDRRRRNTQAGGKHKEAEIARLRRPTPNQIDRCRSQRDAVPDDLTRVAASKSGADERSPGAAAVHEILLVAGCRHHTFG